MTDERTTSRPRWRIAVPWLLIATGLVAAYAYNIYEMWRRWFPAWRLTDLGLYDRFMEGQSYYTHAPLVPLVSVIMAVLLIRHTRIPVRRRPVEGTLIVGGSLLLHLMASLARVNFASGFTIIGVVAGLVLMLWGVTALKRLWFPIAFLFFMVPLPEVSIAQLNFRLKMVAADSGVRLANLIGLVAERSGNKVFLPGDKEMIIANVCNGLRTLISLIAFGSIYAYVCRLRGAWRLGLFAMSVPVAVVSNSIRILALIVVADIWDVKTATGFFHDASGLMIYAIAFGLMFGLERLVLAVRRGVNQPASIRPLFEGVRRTDNDDGQWAAMARAAAGRTGYLAAGLVIAGALGANWLNRTVPATWTGKVAKHAVPRTLTVDGKTLVGHDTKLDEATLTVLETQDYLLRRYARPGVPPTDFCMVFSEDNRKGTHPPDLCLEGGGNDIVWKADRSVRDVPKRGAVNCRELVVQSGRRRTYHLYTYRCGDDYTPSFWTQQLTLFLNGILGSNSGGALIRVSTPVEDDINSARERTVNLMRAAIPYLDRNLPQGDI